MPVGSPPERAGTATTGTSEDTVRPTGRIIESGDKEARVSHAPVTPFDRRIHHRGQVHAMLAPPGVTPYALKVVPFLDEIGKAGAIGLPSRRVAL